MDFDEEKVDDFSLALLYLVVHDRQEGFGARAWKSFDWDTMNRLHEKGLITNPVSKAKSVGMTEKALKSREAFLRNFLWKIKSPPVIKPVEQTSLRSSSFATARRRAGSGFT